MVRAHAKTRRAEGTELYQLLKLAADAAEAASLDASLKIVVDGVTYTAPQRFDWKPGTQHTIEVPAEQTKGDTLYEFGRWNDDGDVSHPVTASPEQSLYTANFITHEKSQVARRLERHTEKLPQ